MSQSQESKKNLPLDVVEIQKIVPHRYPFLLVDRILELDADHAVGLKNVTNTEAFFQGHFPGRPVMPGVLIVEALAQVGGVVVLQRTGNNGKIAYLVGVDKARFRRVVVPGDQLKLEIKVLRAKPRVGLVEAVASVDGEVACEAEIMFTLAD